MKEKTAFYTKRLQTLYPNLTTLLQTTVPLSIRINTLRSKINEIQAALAQLNINWQEVSWYKDALIITHMTTKKLTPLPFYKQGHIYIQSLPSMIPPLVLAPLPKDRVLDMAAAPGSKTSQLAALMNNGGEIIANDTNQRRRYKLKAVLQMLGVTNAKITSFAGQTLWQMYPEQFDKVLLDAPCSLEGTLFYDSASTIKRFAKLQKWLLRSAVSCTKPGGIIVYSTCSMAPEENEGVVDWILKKEAGKVELEQIKLAIPERVPGLTYWQKKTFHPSLSQTVRIPPNTLKEPFFVARLIKKDSNMPTST